MPELISRELVLTFGVGAADTIKLSISKPKAGLTGTDIKTAMDAIVTTAAFGEKAPADSVVGAEYITKQSETVSLA